MRCIGETVDGEEVKEVTREGTGGRSYPTGPGGKGRLPPPLASQPLGHMASCPRGSMLA